MATYSRCSKNVLDTTTIEDLAQYTEENVVEGYMFYI